MEYKLDLDVPLRKKDYVLFCSSKSFITGHTAESGYKKYLTASPSNSTALAGTSSLNEKFYFYTTPNSDNGNNKTKLVIKGNFKADGTGNGETVYYPVKLNYEVKADGTTGVPSGVSSADAYKVLPNKNYKCSVTIKTKGANDPSADIDPTTATIDITVESFTDVNQTTVFQ